jgi:hypothetical protein
MAPPDRFDEFVVSGSHRLLPTALRLTGDPALAEELVLAALAKARPGWRRIEGDPEPTLEKIMETTCTPRWRRRALAAGGRTPSMDRLAEVRSLILQHRARRRRVAAGFVVVLLGIIGYAVVPAPRTTPPRLALSPSPSASASTPLASFGPPMNLIEGFPEYHWGAKVIAAQVEHLPTKRLTLTIVPATLKLEWFERCDYEDTTAPDATLTIDIKVNGRPLGGGGCGGSGRFADWAALGVRVGKPAMFTMTVSGAERFDQQKQRVVKEPVRGTGSIALAIGEQVSFEDYQLPARPATLKPLEDIGYGVPEDPAKTHSIQNSPANPSAPISLVIRWPGGLELQAVSQTPGYLHLAVNGKELFTGEWWDYEQGVWGGTLDRDTEGMPRLKVGQRVTITVRPEHITGDWAVHLWPAQAG